MHRITEPAQPFDVVAHRPCADFQPFGQVCTAPVARDLQEREQPEQSCRGLQQFFILEEELGYVQHLKYFNDNMSGYARLQESAPQNLAHALADSPTGQLAWTAQLLASLDDDHVLTNATLYWLTNTAASAA
ncbi:MULTISPECIES: hypothetical protein [Nocardia]|uniref:hypothetical protein n=1 Tax=Nocardia abscessus TaxID=120957 RepID=UPI002B4B50A6|nr:hypothetical protein [Nocardia abscessus]